jgi:hypothetical protein
MNVEEAGRLAERDSLQKARGGEKTALAEQWSELVHGAQKGDEIQRSQPSLEDQSAQPIVRCVQPIHARRPLCESMLRAGARTVQR